MQSKSQATQHSGSKPVAIVGARGYSGLELARLLFSHPNAQVAACFATEKNWSLSDYLPESKAEAIPVFSMQEFEEKLESFHTVFLATPVETSLELAPKILQKKVNVIDLSGAFRLEPETFKKAYSLTHSQTELLKTAQYGLQPWVSIQAKPNGTLISNPGCYATSVLMALIPLLKMNLIDADSIAIDAKSGTTGAGKKASENLLFTEVDGECLPYRVGKHQHLPEIAAYVQKFTNKTIDPFFVTNLLPAKRGIISTIFARLTKPETGAAAIENAYKEFYGQYSLVRSQELSSQNERPSLLLKKVVGSARTHIRFTVNGDKLYLFSLIDNLMKGAASQAVENFNSMMKLPLDTGLSDKEGVL